MNSTDIIEIKETWKIAFADPNASGQAILLHFFKKHPHNIQKFRAFRECPVDQLKDNVKFKAHASNIIYLFNQTISFLGDEDFTAEGSTIEEIWVKVAKSHFRRQISKEAFIELRGVIIEKLSELCKLNGAQQQAWIKLMDIVYEILFNTVDELAKQTQNM